MSWEDHQTSTKAEFDEDSSTHVRVSLVLHFKKKIRIIPLAENRPVVIGRGRETDVQISDAMLSRRHASFEFSHGEVIVEDLNSTNGTTLNGRAIRSGRVKTGDRVAMGGIAASIHTLRPTNSIPGVATHEKFLSALQKEVQKASRTGSSLCVVIARSFGQAPDTWHQEIRNMLGSKDRMAIHSAEMVELLLKGTAERAQKLAETIAADPVGEAPACFCGIAKYPDAADAPEQLLDAARQALQHASATAPVQWSPCKDPDPRHSGGSWSSLVSTPTMQVLHGTVLKLARSAIPVLVCGETGTGKEVIAKAIHDSSLRSEKPLLCINCGAIPDTLIESELFGHERGAFTGADRRAKGIFEEADGGSVLLDEIGELSPSAQAALLRVLETKRVTRVGSSRAIAVDVRILASTHRDLEAMCEQRTFRLDLLHRLNTMTLRVPPLRERRDEVEPLAEHFLRRSNEANNCRVSRISPAVLALLRQYSWPGNVRELRNVIDHAVVVAGEGIIAMEHLPDRILVGSTTQRPPKPDTVEDALAIDPGVNTVVRQMPTGSFKHHVRRIEAALIGEALRATDWTKAEAARRLQIPLRTLKEKVQVERITRENFNAREASLLVQEYHRTLSRSPNGMSPTDFKGGIQRYESVLISEALREFGGNKAATARHLQIPLRTLKNKIQSYGIDC